MLGLLPVDESTVMGREIKNSVSTIKDAQERYENFKESMVSNLRRFRDSESEKQQEVNLRFEAKRVLKEARANFGAIIVDSYRFFYQLPLSKS